ncbi:DUF6441 family protein [Telmatospirillum sp. J64-1]|uniref:DUF6441 family protein n=1 Tax=Telmatospirillum sp. J64-1 TaxID=2502183 RepID=UPI00115C673A|nr:DUF6441 family protein [Telmatospirillum sp. J64-1]
MVKIRASTPDIRAYAESLGREGAVAVTAGVEAAVKGMQLDLRQQVLRAGFADTVANMIGAEAYPKRGKASFRASGTIFARGESADDILSSISEGVRISGQGRYLAIPTGYNKAGGRRRSRTGPLITPQQMSEMRKMTFVRPGTNGTLVWFLRVTHAQEMRRGKVQSLAFAGGRYLVGSGRRKRTAAILEAGAVPMFILVPQVRMKRAMDVDATMRRWAERMPALIERALPKED